MDNSNIQNKLLSIPTEAFPKVRQNNFKSNSKNYNKIEKKNEVFRAYDKLPLIASNHNYIENNNYKTFYSIGNKNVGRNKCKWTADSNKKHNFKNPSEYNIRPIKNSKEFEEYIKMVEDERKN